MKFDFIIVGGGIVGLSSAWQLKQSVPEASVLLLEKEKHVALHQSGRNSGVIHAGVYYEPGSLKAEFCRRGAAATYDFCSQHGVACEQTGKIIAAGSEAELGRLHALFDRCRENRLEPAMLSKAELRKLEPQVTAADAFLVGASGIADYPAMCRAMLQLFHELGGESRMGAEVTGISEHADRVTIHCGEDVYQTSRLVVCGGLIADRLARMQGLDVSFRIIPFRGEYYRLSRRAARGIRHLIYPVPDPALPFLGVHLTRMTDGSVTVGPNAVQGWKREGYGRLNFNFRDTSEILSYPGFWKLAARHFRFGVREMVNSVWKRAYLQQVRKYCPHVTAEDLLPSPAGVRAQAVLPDGTMVHDFLFAETDRSLHVCNAPSPAATSALPIGQHICERLLGPTSQEKSSQDR